MARAKDLVVFFSNIIKEERGEKVAVRASGLSKAQHPPPPQRQPRSWPDRARKVKTGPSHFLGRKLTKKGNAPPPPCHFSRRLLKKSARAQANSLPLLFWGESKVKPRQQERASASAGQSQPIASARLGPIYFFQGTGIRSARMKFQTQTKNNQLGLKHT